VIVGGVAAGQIIEGALVTTDGFGTGWARWSGRTSWSASCCCGRLAGAAAAPGASRSVCGGCRVIVVLNGPNLNLLGTREPEIYGSTHVRRPDGAVRANRGRGRVPVQVWRTDHEGELI